MYRRLGEGRSPGAATARWFGKPAGVAYPDFLARVPAAEAWQRQLVLGPAPEFCVVGAAPPSGAVGVVEVPICALWEGDGLTPP